MNEELHIRKSDLNAVNVYQFDMLKNLKYSFIPYKYEQTVDELKIIYDISELGSIRDFVSARKKVKYSILIELMEIMKENSEIYFPLDPDNIFINQQQRVKILRRDVKLGEDSRLDELRALAGFLLQRKYSYNDYIDGGISLLSKNNATKFLQECVSEEELYGKLTALFDKEERREKAENLIVKKSGYKALRFMTVLLFFISIIFAVMFFRQKVLISKPLSGALKAERAYIEKDYINVIDALSDIQVKDMDVHEKYILAVAYIRSQSVDAFSSETKEMLTERLAYNSDEKQLDYWLYLGRLDADAAIDTAQRISDNQLLLYAYIQKLEILSADTAISGDDKFSQIESIRENIKSLAETLGIKYELESTEQ